MSRKHRRRNRPTKQKKPASAQKKPAVEQPTSSEQNKLAAEKKPPVTPQQSNAAPQTQAPPSPRSWWQGLSKSEKLLLAGVLMYLVLDAVYFRGPSSFLRFCVLLMGIALAAGVTEFARRERGRFKFLLIALLGAGAAVVEVRKDKNEDRERDVLLGKLDAQHKKIVALGSSKDRNREVSRIEQSIDYSGIDPRDTAKSVANSGLGFMAKAEWLSLRAALLESRLLTNVPSQASKVLAFPEEARQKLAAYEGLHNEPAFTNAATIRLVHNVQEVLAEEANYLGLAEHFRVKIAPLYEALNQQSKDMDEEAVAQRLGEIEATLAQQLTNFPVAGLYNHLGNLAMAQNATNRALQHFYTGISRDPHHLPLYESIAFASWSLHHATWPALTYSAQGIDLLEKLSLLIDSEFKEASENYATLARFSPDLNVLLTKRTNQLEASFNSVRLTVTNQASALRDKLELMFAYNSALELQNEAIARDYAKRLYDSDPEDPEYEDTWGFVLLRFWHDERELDEAEKLFKKARSKAKAAGMTGQLARAHEDELQKVRRRMSLGQP